MNKKGFSLIEILGVIVLISIVLGIVSVSYAKLDKQVDKAYYKNLENSLIISGGEYFKYNNANTNLNQLNKVNIKTLIDKKYIPEDNFNNDECDLNKSYVGVFKESNYKNDYFVCLICNDYISSNDKCFK